MVDSGAVETGRRVMTELGMISVWLAGLLISAGLALLIRGAELFARWRRDQAGGR